MKERALEEREHEREHEASEREQEESARRQDEERGGEQEDATWELPVVASSRAGFAARFGFGI